MCFISVDSREFREIRGGYRKFTSDLKVSCLCLLQPNIMRNKNAKNCQSLLIALKYYKYTLIFKTCHVIYIYIEKLKYKYDGTF